MLSTFSFSPKSIYDPRLKPGTWRRYSNDIRLHLTPTFGHKRLDTITRQDIRELIATKREAGLAWNSVRNFICPLREVPGGNRQAGDCLDDPQDTASQATIRNLSATTSLDTVLPNRISA